LTLGADAWSKASVDAPGREPPVTPSIGEAMNRTIRSLALVALALSLAACAAAPPPVAVIEPPAKKPLDAKTQLETGKTY
jgi:hypothetical protein